MVRRQQKQGWGQQPKTSRGGERIQGERGSSEIGEGEGRGCSRRPSRRKREVVRGWSAPVRGQTGGGGCWNLWRFCLRYFSNFWVGINSEISTIFIVILGTS